MAYLMRCPLRLHGGIKIDDTVVQPDIVVICDKTKLDDKGGYKGAPELVVEIISPSTEKRDRFIKLKLYQNAGVNEYWIVDPDHKTVSVHILNNGVYNINVFDEDETVSVHVLEGCDISLPEVFEI